MDQTQQLIALTVAAGVGILATILILRRERHDREPPVESEYATSTEGEKRCPNCGMGNLWTGTSCISCGADLPG